MARLGFTTSDSQCSRYSWSVQLSRCAAAYCDFVVAEKKVGDALQHHNELIRAKVITDVRNLPELIFR